MAPIKKGAPLPGGSADSKNNTMYSHETTAALPAPTPNGHAPSGYPDIITPATTSGRLSARHRQELEDSGISSKAIEARGYFTETDKVALHLLGFAASQCCLTPALVIPLCNYRGERESYSIKPDIPRNDGRNGKPIKYEMPSKSSPVLDVARLTSDQIDDPTKPLIITEGAKKADSAASRGLCAINLNGVYGFRSKVAALPDWENIALKGRAIFVVFDSDATTNPSVEAALARLCHFLQSRGAVVKVVSLDKGPGGEKTGLDDFFARGGDVNGLFILARDLEPTKARREREITAVLNLPDSDAAEFPELTADQIPKPKTANEHTRRPEYDTRQIVEMLRPGWNVTALTTHAAHAERIKAHLGEDVVFTVGLGWVVWSGQRQQWEIDDKESSATAAKVAELSRITRAEGAALYRHAKTLADANRGDDAAAIGNSAGELLRHSKQCESANFTRGALHFAAGAMRQPVATFGAKPWRLSFQNGTWDRGQWRENLRDDFSLYLSPVAMDFNADRAEWNAVLNRITGGDHELSRTLQDIAGYALSGASHLRALPWFYGGAGTGKSTVAELLQTVLGEMSATIDPKNLQDSASRERLGANLWNRRAAIVGEAGNQRIDAELLKTLSGSDSLTVRLLYKEPFTASPSHVLLLVSNDPPRVDAYDKALKDRVIALPFTHRLNDGPEIKLTGGARIEAVRRDPNSPLVRGFAVWALEGLDRLYKSQQIYRAACVTKATRQFWRDTDAVTPFWETLEDGELTKIRRSALRQKYETWCATEGTRPLNRPQWIKACEAYGLSEGRTIQGERYWEKSGE